MDLASLENLVDLSMLMSLKAKELILKVVALFYALRRGCIFMRFSKIDISMSECCVLT